jgi:L-methionine (R)-S-oxide reductase
MAEELTILENGTKEEQYEALLPQIEGLLHGEPDFVANMANLCAVLNTQFNHLWTGFYLVKGDQLVLGPFQGPIACTRIQKGKGVCGTAWETATTQIVPDVEQFPGHIACSSLSKSEIVVPLIKQGVVIGVLDIDSAELNTFDEVDAYYLTKIIDILIKNTEIN